MLGATVSQIVGLQSADPADHGERFVVVGYRARNGALLEQAVLAFKTDQEQAMWMGRKRIMRGETTFIVDRQKMEANDRRALGLEPNEPGYGG